MNEDIRYTEAYPPLADTKQPRSAGPKPIVASQKIKNVETAYDFLCSDAFLVTIVVHAELSVPKPSAAHTAHTNTVTVDGMTAIKNNPIACAVIPKTQISMSP